MEVNRNNSCKIYVRTEELKDFFNATSFKQNIFHDQNSWTQLQELQKLYKKLLLSDIEYSLEKKIEIDLWNYCFKDYITYLQLQIRNAKSNDKDKAHTAVPSVLQTHQGGMRRAAEIGGPDLNITLQWFLEMASGFFILLLEEICIEFDLNFAFLRRNRFCFNNLTSDGNETLSKVRKQELREKLEYICQFCLVHLGDIARYRNDFKQALVYYRQAIEVSPESGQAYNQIALLQAIAGNSLSSISYYVRSIELEQPFPAASTNLSKIFGDLSSKKFERSPINKSNFVSEFLRFHALLHEVRNLHIAYQLCTALNEAVSSLVATESLSTLQLIQMVIISIFRYERISGHPSSLSSNAQPMKREDLSLEEKVIQKLVIECIAGMLNAFLLPVYTLMQGKSLLKYFALPATKVLLDWITINPETLQEVGFLKRLQIWPSLCQVLNELSSALMSTSESHKADLESFPLPEDYDLRAYIPLQKRLSSYKYRSVALSKQIDDNTVYVLRAKRLIDLGIIISKFKIGEGQNIIRIVKKPEGENAVEKFESVELHITSKDIDDDILAEIENLKVEEEFSDQKNDIYPNDTNEDVRSEVNKLITDKYEDSAVNPLALVNNKQRSIEELQQNTRKGQRTNVAMSTILRHAANAPDKASDPDRPISSEITKQVKFQQSSQIPHNLKTTNSMKYLDVPGAKLSAAGSSNIDQNKTSAQLDTGTIDFSVPPPSLLQPPSANMASGMRGHQINHGIPTSNMPNSLSDLLISQRTNQMYSKQPTNPNKYQYHSFPQNLNMATQSPNMQLPFPSNEQINRSTLWPGSQQLQSDNLGPSQSELAEKFRYQLPQFGGINRTEQPLPTKNPGSSKSISGIASDNLQFTQPYPKNEVRSEIMDSSDASLNRASPMYHRLFSMDPTWSVTPGSLQPPNPETSALDSFLNLNMGNQPGKGLSNSSDQSNVKEMLKPHNDLTKK